MMLASDIDTKVTGAVQFFGLVLVLATLFTAELQRRYDVQDDLEKPRKARIKRVKHLTVATLVLTVTAFLSLGPWAFEVLGTIGHEGSFDPNLVIFEVAWLLLLGLCFWQGALVVACKSLAKSAKAID